MKNVNNFVDKTRRHLAVPGRSKGQKRGAVCHSCDTEFPVAPC